MTRSRLAAIAAALTLWTALLAAPIGTTAAAFTSTTGNGSNTFKNLVLQAGMLTAATSRPLGDVELTWTASPTEGVASVTYTILRRPTGVGSYAEVISGLGGTTYTDTPPSDGTYDYVLRAVVSSFTRDSAVRTGVSDATAPTMSIACAGATCSSGWYTTSTVSVTVTGTDSGSGMASVSRSIDGASTITTNGSSATFNVTGSASHTIAYYGTDVAGNVRASASQVVKIDTGAPTSASSLAAATGTTAGTVDLTWVAGSDAVSGLEGYDIQTAPPAGNGRCTGQLTWTTYGHVGTVTLATVSGLVSGTAYCFQLITYDIAGNTSTSSAVKGTAQ